MKYFICSSLMLLLLNDTEYQEFIPLDASSSKTYKTKIEWSRDKWNDFVDRNRNTYCLESMKWLCTLFYKTFIFSFDFFAREWLLVKYYNYLCYHFLTVDIHENGIKKCENLTLDSSLHASLLSLRNFQKLRKFMNIFSLNVHMDIYSALLKCWNYLEISWTALARRIESDMIFELQPLA